jgi:hypothetical protein
MDGAQVGVLKETHEVCLGSLLKSKHCMALETQVSLHKHNKQDENSIIVFLRNVINNCMETNLTLKSWAISLTSLWNGSFLMSSSVLFWYLRISLQSHAWLLEFDNLKELH